MAGEKKDITQRSVPRLITDPEMERIVFSICRPIKRLSTCNPNTNECQESSMNKPIDGQKLTN